MKTEEKEELVNHMINGGRLINKSLDEVYWNGKYYIIDFKSGGSTEFKFKYIDKFTKKYESISKEDELKAFMLNGGRLISSRGDEAYWDGVNYKINFNSGGSDLLMFKYLNTFKKKDTLGRSDKTNSKLKTDLIDDEPLYVVIETINKEDLTNQVGALLKKGYSLNGSLIVIPKTAGANQKYIQSLFKA